MSVSFFCPALALVLTINPAMLLAEPPKFCDYFGSIASEERLTRVGQSLFSRRENPWVKCGLWGKIIFHNPLLLMIFNPC